MNTKVLLLLATAMGITHAKHLKGFADLGEDMSTNPDYENLKQLGLSSPDVQFDLAVKEGVNPSDAEIDINSFKGEVQVEDMGLAANEDREAQFLSICKGIERLFTGEVLCTCNNPILNIGTIEFDCKYLREVSRRELSFTPQYKGTFVYRLFAIDYKFTGRTCAGEVFYYSQRVRSELNLGNFCVSYDLIANFNRDRGLTVGLTGCDVTLGLGLGTCKTCSPCTTSSGGPGFKLDCSWVTQQGGRSCIPLGLPIGRSSGRTDGANFFSGLNLSRAIANAEAEFLAQQQAAAAGSMNTAAMNAPAPTPRPTPAPVAMGKMMGKMSRPTPTAAANTGVGRRPNN